MKQSRPSAAGSEGTPPETTSRVTRNIPQRGVKWSESRKEGQKRTKSEGSAQELSKTGKRANLSKKVRGVREAVIKYANISGHQNDVILATKMLDRL